MLHQFKKKDESFLDVETLFNVFRNPVSGVAECIICTSTELGTQRVGAQDDQSLIVALQREVFSLKELLVRSLTPLLVMCCC